MICTFLHLIPDISFKSYQNLAQQYRKVPCRKTKSSLSVAWLFQSYFHSTNQSSKKWVQFSVDNYESVKTKWNAIFVIKMLKPKKSRTGYSTRLTLKLILHSYHKFKLVEFGNGGQIWGSSQFSLLPQMSHNTMLASTVVQTLENLV